jgi:hypothetical protein
MNFCGTVMHRSTQAELGLDAGLVIFDSPARAKLSALI